MGFERTFIKGNELKFITWIAIFAFSAGGLIVSHRANFKENEIQERILDRHDQEINELKNTAIQTKNNSVKIDGLDVKVTQLDKSSAVLQAELKHIIRNTDEIKRDTKRVLKNTSDEFGEN